MVTWSWWRQSPGRLQRWPILLLHLSEGVGLCACVPCRSHCPLCTAGKSKALWFTAVLTVVAQG